MYNFNPKNKDIETVIPDEANGRFELCGLSQEYLNVSEVKRIFKFDVNISELSTPSLATVNNENIVSDHSSSPGLMDPTGSMAAFSVREIKILKGITP